MHRNEVRLEMISKIGSPRENTIGKNICDWMSSISWHNVTSALRIIPELGVFMEHNLAVKRCALWTDAHCEICYLYHKYHIHELGGVRVPGLGGIMEFQFRSQFIFRPPVHYRLRRSDPWMTILTQCFLRSTWCCCVTTHEAKLTNSDVNVIYTCNLFTIPNMARVMVQFR